MDKTTETEKMLDKNENTHEAAEITTKPTTTRQRKTTTKKTDDPESVTLDELKKLLADAQKTIADLKKEKEEGVWSASTQVNRLVTLWFQDEINPENVMQFGPNGKYGTITGKTGMLVIPVVDFKGGFRDTMVTGMLADRTLVVVDGLTDDERLLYGVKYKDGELLRDYDFVNLLSLSEERILEIFPALCPSNKEMVARKFLSAYEDGNLEIKKETILKLNKISKKDYEAKGTAAQKRGAFAALLERMAENIEA